MTYYLALGKVRLALPITAALDSRDKKVAAGLVCSINCSFAPHSFFVVLSSSVKKYFGIALIFKKNSGNVLIF